NYQIILGVAPIFVSPTIVDPFVLYTVPIKNHFFQHCVPATIKYHEKFTLPSLFTVYDSNGDC
ncbi:MAG: hypothetical protein Q8K02_08105, partial [Flavobacterium sp.]|nr:hypothetical protein [Flavobacterium sp.]